MALIVFWVVLTLILLNVFIYFVAGNQREAHITTESTKTFPENENPPLSAP
jgi:uncharacterized membrane protein